ncbi:hypothetical protein K469DRAFT_639535 [Zopfia rhizophila CBS 207.26]|uniref:Nudix hydrolase domain-containing protein n=1 Tax=Zopfia rhizophila CBS 207.26 TaxID=1314779 RepID=A0A6A6DM38_9PEZI|nr:hypothetical protein K469DRAFT_639535 [Zopfia rhizophila CBS 207.26]
MSDTKLPFECPSSLNEYLIPEKEFYIQNPHYNMLCTGAVVFNSEGKLLLIQRASDEKAFPNCWEVPGGKVDDDDETLLHAVARELKEETGLDVTKIVRKVAEFGWKEKHKRTAQDQSWLKHIFEVEVKEMKEIVLDPAEHQRYLFVTEKEVVNDKVGDVQLSYITPPNKAVKLEAFRLRRDAMSA